MGVEIPGGGLATPFCSYKALSQPHLLPKWDVEVKKKQKKTYQKEAPSPSKPPTKRQCDFRCLYRCLNGSFCWRFLGSPLFIDFGSKHAQKKQKVVNHRWPLGIARMHQIWMWIFSSRDSRESQDVFFRSCVCAGNVPFQSNKPTC